MPDRSGTCQYKIRRQSDRSGCCLIKIRQLPNRSGTCQIKIRRQPDRSGCCLIKIRHSWHQANLSAWSILLRQIRWSGKQRKFVRSLVSGMRDFYITEDHLSRVGFRGKHNILGILYSVKCTCWVKYCICEFLVDLCGVTCGLTAELQGPKTWRYIPSRVTKRLTAARDFSCRLHRHSAPAGGNRNGKKSRSVHLFGIIY